MVELLTVWCDEVVHRSIELALASRSVARVLMSDRLDVGNGGGPGQTSTALRRRMRFAITFGPSLHSTTPARASVPRIATKNLRTPPAGHAPVLGIPTSFILHRGTRVGAAVAWVSGA